MNYISAQRSYAFALGLLLAMLTLGVPAIVMGFGMLWAWVRVPLLWGSIWILIVALIGAWIAVAVRAIVPAFMQVHTDLEESALMSGSSPLTTLRRITVPLVLVSPLELLLYLPLLTLARLKGTVESLRGQKSWNKFERNARRAPAA